MGRLPQHWWGLFLIIYTPPPSPRTIIIHHHRILLLLVEHRASMKSFQALWSPAIPLTSFHNLLVLLISSSTVLHHVLFGLPLLLYPWGFQSNEVFSIAPASLRNVCPIRFHFLHFIWFSIEFCWVILHSSSFVILSVHFTFIIRLKHLFTNICSLLFTGSAVFQVSQAYNCTGFTSVLKIRIFNLFQMLRFLHTGYSWTNTPFAFLILLDSTRERDVKYFVNAPNGVGLFTVHKTGLFFIQNRMSPQQPGKILTSKNKLQL